VKLACGVVEFDLHQPNQNAIARYRVWNKNHPTSQATNAFASIIQVCNAHLNQLTLSPKVWGGLIDSRICITRPLGRGHNILLPLFVSPLVAKLQMLPKLTQ
jgi:hypothetical protein